MAFYYCTGLKDITLGKELTEIGDGAFSGCDNLTKAVINCKTIPELNIKNLREAILGSTVTEIGPRAFSYSENLAKSATVLLNTAQDLQVLPSQTVLLK